MAACGAEITPTRLLLIIIILSFLSHLGREIVLDSECVVLVVHEKGQKKKVCDRIAD